MSTKQDERFSVKRTKTGLGLFANASFKKGSRIIEYIGEVITVDEANRRGGKYLFAATDYWYIDGKERGNIARYINHSCDPNTEAGGTGKRVFIYALKNIKPGDEITYDYGEEYFDAYIKPIGCKCQKCAKG